MPTRLLRETLRGRMTPASSSACIDTETLAAWSDGALSARERAAAESHASICLDAGARLVARVDDRLARAGRRRRSRRSVVDQRSRRAARAIRCAAARTFKRARAFYAPRRASCRVEG
ncbi:MAG: hypothetical protein DMG03_12575 [Acidobacteria bacterium]|nr:MAG: hypothetical protein DMG03_12575 [Acidobacteriota bacterium]